MGGGAGCVHTTRTHPTPCDTMNVNFLNISYDVVVKVLKLLVRNIRKAGTTRSASTTLRIRCCCCRQRTGTTNVRNTNGPADPRSPSYEGSNLSRQQRFRAASDPTGTKGNATVYRSSFNGSLTFNDVFGCLSSTNTLSTTGEISNRATLSRNWRRWIFAIITEADGVRCSHDRSDFNDPSS